MINTIVVDDHTIFRQCITTKINATSRYRVIAETGKGTEAIELTKQYRPDLVIMDISLPDLDGIEVSRRILRLVADVKIILLTMYKYPELIEYIKDIGIKGYVLKNDAFEDLIHAINEVMAGRQYFSRSLDISSFENLLFYSRCSRGLLSPREKEVLRLIAMGHTTREIARILSISCKTVETHRAKIKEKTGSRNLADMVRYALKIGLISP